MEVKTAVCSVMRSWWVCCCCCCCCSSRTWGWQKWPVDGRVCCQPGNRRWQSTGEYVL